MGRPFDDVMRDLAQAIVGGEFGEGTRLPGADELGTQFGAGRSVLRDALLALELRGLVAVETGRGRRVQQRERWDLRDPVVLWACLERGFEPELAAQAVRARAAIERMAAEHACEHATDGDIELLAARVAAIERALAPGVARGFDAGDPLVRAEVQFHELLVQLSENLVLAKLAEPLHETLALWRRRHAPERDRAALQHHRRILEGVSARDRELAAAAVDGYARQLVRWLPSRR